MISATLVDLLWKFTLIFLGLFFNVVVLVYFRLMSSIPSELDRIGSDLSLYGWGIGLSILLSTQTSHPMLGWLPAARVTLIVSVALVVNLALYILNMRFSKLMRAIKPELSEGLESYSHLREVLSHKSGFRLFVWSIILGLSPTVVLAALELWGH